MKAKINRGAGFRGVLDYTHEKETAEHIAGNMSGRTVGELTKEFGITKKLRPDCKNPVWHCSLALPEGDRLNAEKWDELSADFMREMGMDPANFLYDVQRHSDTNHDHIHIVASRIGLDGSLWHGQNDVFKAIETTQRLEQRHGLTLTPGLDPEHKKDRKTLTAAEVNMGVRTEIKPPRLVAQEAIDAVLQSEGVISAPEFITRLERLGVRAVPAVASTGTMNGFSFECEGISFTGSKLGEGYKWAKLQTKGVEYVKNRDFEELADAKRLAGQRAADTAGAGQQQPAPGRDNPPGAGVEPATGLGSSAGYGVPADARPSHQATGPGGPGVGSVRQSEPGSTGKLGGVGAGDEQPGNQRDADQGAGAGQDHASIGGPGAKHAIVNAEYGGQQQEAGSIAGEVVHVSRERSDIDADRSASVGRSSAERETAPMGDAGPNAGQRSTGGASGGGWASRFKQASAARRDAAAGGPGLKFVGQGNAGRNKVADAHLSQARQIDPTAYLESQGFDVKKEGRHLSVRQNGDEAYRVTRKDDGHWVTCDRFENGIGDNIALVQEMEPGTGFAESVYRLSGAPSVAKATRPAPSPVVRVPPKMPAQDPADVKRGRAYLFERGITPETIEQAEKAGMLRYSARGVLFIGRDEAGTAQNITHRAVDASELVQKRDLFGTDKRHPQMLLGATGTVLIVNGGTDALAAVDIARREKRPAPTVLVSGGANVKGFMQTPWVQKLLMLAKRVIVAFERGATPDVQAKTDAAHQVQMQWLQEICTAQVTGWKPPDGIKDMAALNLHQVQKIEVAAAQKAASQQQLEWELQEAAKPPKSWYDYEHP